MSLSLLMQSLYAVSLLAITIGDSGISDLMPHLAGVDYLT